MPINISHSINKFTAIALQMSNNKNVNNLNNPSKPIFDNKSINHHKISKLSGKLNNNYKYQAPKKI